MYTGYIMYTLYTVQLTREEVCKLYSLYNGRYGAFCCIIYIFLYINLYRRRALYTVYTRIQQVYRGCHDLRVVLLAERIARQKRFSMGNPAHEGLPVRRHRGY